MGIKANIVFSPSIPLHFIKQPILVFVIIFAFLSATTMARSQNLTVLQWNARSLNTNFDHLTQFLQDTESNYDVIALQSIGANSYTMPVISGFHYPPFYSASEGKIRTATYIRKGNIAYNKYIKDLSHGHAVILDLQGEEPICLINVYFPKSIISDNDLKWIHSLEKGRYIICGDFNAHSPLWDSNLCQSDKAGSLIEEVLDNSELCLLNNGTITRIPDSIRERASAIDLSLCSPCICLKMDWSVLDDPLGSDHLPIHITYDNSPNFSFSAKPDNYIYAKANWSKFRKILENYTYTENFSEIDLWYSQFQALVISAADSSIPKSNGNNIKDIDLHKHNDWWNENCRNERASYRKCVKRYKSNRSLENFESMKKQKVKYNKTIAEAKLSYWTSYVNENVQTYRDSNILYRKLNQVKGRFDPPERPLVINNNNISDPKEEANIFAKTFASVSKNASLSPDQLEFRKNEESKFENPTFIQSSSDTNFSPIELNRALFSIKKVMKATGTDPISYIMIKKLPNKTKSVLLKFFNFLWQQGKLPKAWKEAEI